jgi:hypothetical protein
MAIEFILPRNRGLCRRPGIDAHRVVLPADEVTVEDRIPVTTPARGLFDPVAVLRADQLEHAFKQAEVRRLTSPTSLDALVARYPGRRGTAAIRRVLDKQRAHGETVTRSRLERRFKAFEEDRERDRALQVAGWRVVRITRRQLIADGDTIAARQRALLG